jgi:hypothetical protein
MRHILFAQIAFLTLVSITGCGSSGGDGDHGGDPMGGPPGKSAHESGDQTASESLNGQCISTTLKGTKGEGAACTSPSECAPTCCTCASDSSKEWLGARCLDGKCASSTMCALPDKTSFYCN